MKQLIVIGGLGSNTHSNPAYREIAKNLEPEFDHTTFIDGAYRERLTGELIVMPPVMQIEQALATIRSKAEKISVITHCLGMSADIAVADRYDSANLVAISPSYPTPIAVATHRKLLEKITRFGGKLPTYWWSDLSPSVPHEDRMRLAKIPENLYTATADLSTGFVDIISALGTVDKLATVHITDDWNEASRSAMPEMPADRQLLVNTTHNMLQGEGTIDTRALRIARFVSEVSTSASTSAPKCVT